MKELTDVLLVGRSGDVLIVGRKRELNDSVEIINALQGEEAKELYDKLIAKKEAVTNE